MTVHTEAAKTESTSAVVVACTEVTSLSTPLVLVDPTVAVATTITKAPQISVMSLWTPRNKTRTLRAKVQTPSTTKDRGLTAATVPTSVEVVESTAVVVVETLPTVVAETPTTVAAEEATTKTTDGKKLRLMKALAVSLELLKR